VTAGDDAIIAYYTFAATSALLADMPPDVTKRLPRYPLVPGALIGRLAVDQSAQRDGLGSAMLMDAAQRAHSADPAVHSLVVEAKDEKAVRFYQKFGFRPFVSIPQRLFMPVATAIAAINA
jgi:GNAT superfamily N-acetyltransferase